jgi:ABC-type transport system involved in cytochrome c biogenesis permease component
MSLVRYRRRRVLLELIILAVITPYISTASGNVDRAKWIIPLFQGYSRYSLKVELKVFLCYS